MLRKRFLSLLCLVLMVALVLGISPLTAQSQGRPGAVAQAEGQTRPSGQAVTVPADQNQRIVTYEERMAAAAQAKAAGYPDASELAIGPGDTPHYYGPTPNYANSPLPKVITSNAAPLWYFAEGTCRPGFIPYITIENPGSIDASVMITYMMGNGQNKTVSLMVKKNSRATVLPNEQVPVAEDPSSDFSTKVQCINGQNIMVERPMYFNYRGKWNGGHNVVGANMPATVWYFAEGTSRPDFDPWICIQNPNAAAANVKITYMMGDGKNIVDTLTVPKNARSTVDPTLKLGRADDAAHDFSAKVECTNGKGIVVERPMYFNYDFKWNGGHDAMGATELGTSFYFAEGTVRPDFDPYFCIQNPGGSDAAVTLTYMKGDGNIQTEKVTVPKASRKTVTPRLTLGTGNDAVHDFSTKVECTNGKMILAERPMYFNYNGMWDDGHIAVGAAGTGSTYYFAEGTCRPNFDPYLCIQNPGASNAAVMITYMKGDATTATQSLTVNANSRSTITPRAVLGTGDDAAHDFSAKVRCTNGQQILVERPMYFNYSGDTGGSNAVGYGFAGQTTTVVAGTGMRKFINKLPGLGAANANDLGQYIPVAVPDKTSYPGSDYYEIEIGQYREKMHGDLPGTLLRGYRQTNAPDPTVNRFHYLGPLIIADKDVPIRLKVTNSLPIGAAGDLFVPVDTTLMGAGMTPTPGENYTQNRAAVHLHGGNSPWISDGTPHQWIVPAGETTTYARGASLQNVPDMWYDAAGNPVPAGTPGASNDPGPGNMTFYYTNQQSSRMLFYHDHAAGITRLNVYVGEAAGYLIRDDAEKALIAASTIPTDEIPLVIQDRTFVPDDAQLQAEDPTWDKAKWGGKGNFWLPHVYMPNQNAGAEGGMNAFGRWHYGPWFWPPTNNIANPPKPNPYAGQPGEPPLIPGTPTPSMAMEAFMDTPIVNGTAYPVLEVQPKSYRLRVLNACNDRFLNLQLYKANSTATMWNPNGTLNDGQAGEVKMVPAVPTPGFPELWPTDGRDGGVPDPATAGPSWIQIANESGFLPAPAVIPQQPVNWNLDPTTFNFGNVSDHSFLLGSAERGDVILDFSKYAGQTLILYNDAPAAFPARDPRYDYYTGGPDLTEIGGAPTTQAGYGPNTRTIMQIKVANTTPAPAFNMAKLNAAFASTATTPGVFAASQDTTLIPDSRYNSAYNANFPVDTYTRIGDTIKNWTTVSGTPMSLTMEPKAIQDEMGETFDMEYGRMSAMLGLEMAGTGAQNQNFVTYPFPSPPTDIVIDSVTPGAEPAPGDGTQVWKITHNGVDTHTLHFHKFDVQLINHVAWDNSIRPPDDNELGWKETVRVDPLEDTIVAIRAVAPTLPFTVPNSYRPIDPSRPVGDPLPLPPPVAEWQDPLGDPIDGPFGQGTVANEVVNFGWEYVIHCHLLGHEEMDMMHAMPFVVGTEVAPSDPSNVVGTGTSPNVDLSWTDNALNETSFEIEWANNIAGPWTWLAQVPPSSGTGATVHYNDTTDWVGSRWYRVTARNSIGSRIINFPKVNSDSAAVMSNEVITP